MKYLILLIFVETNTLLISQCSFKSISNDTTYQDYVEFIYAKQNIDEILTFGSRYNRGIINDSIYDAPVYQTFDYCGILLNKIIYKNIGKYRLLHKVKPTHNTYVYEPISNSVIRKRNGELLMVDRAYDTITNDQVLILVDIDFNGKVINYKTIPVGVDELGYPIKNVLELKDGRILVVIWDYTTHYTFIYFTSSNDLLFKNILELSRGIRSIQEVDNDEFVCTSLAYDSLSFQVYRFNLSGEIKWLINTYKGNGSAREVLLRNNKLYVSGAIQGLFGIFMICSLDGQIINKFIFPTTTQNRICSAYIPDDDFYFLAGHKDHTDISGQDISIMKIDTFGNLLWDSLYDFRSSLGTPSNGQGQFDDYGGYGIIKTNDGSLVTFGLSIYESVSGSKVNHRDAVLIKTSPGIISKVNQSRKEQPAIFTLRQNPVNDFLELVGPLNNIKKYIVNDITGNIIFHSDFILGTLPISSLSSGIYILEIIENNNDCHYLKFIKA